MATFFEQWLDRRMRVTTEKDYIEFVDPVVAQICANTWGDGIGITYAQAAAVTNLNNVFKGNTSIVSFDELQYFTSLSTLNGANSNSTGEFNGCSSLVSITFPSSLTTIGGHAFYGCSSLESVWGGNVTYFGYGCFRECSSLLDIDISHATQVYGYAFYLTDLSGKEISMPNLTRFDALAFTGSNISKVLNLGSITSLPDHSYGAGPFSSCTSLTQVTLPSTCGTINRYSFSGCTSLTTVTNNSSSFIVRDYAFDGCTSLSSINLNNATSVGEYSFRSTALTSVNLSSCTTVNRAAFRYTPITSITFGTATTTIGREAFDGCTSLTSLALPVNLTSIVQNAFSNCTSLATVTYAGSGTFTVGSEGFRYCPLTSFPTEAISSVDAGYAFHRHRMTFMEFSASCTSLGSRAFISLLADGTPQTVIMRKTTPPTLGNDQVFHRDNGLGGFYINSGIKIYVPWSSDHSILDAYKAATNWRVYANYIYELDENGDIPS